LRGSIAAQMLAMSARGISVEKPAVELLVGDRDDLVPVAHHEAALGEEEDQPPDIAHRIAAMQPNFGEISSNWKMMSPDPT
jgi:hypothetical protein